MFRSHWTIIREHVIPIPKVTIEYLLVRYTVVLRQHAAAEPQCNVLISNQW